MIYAVYGILLIIFIIHSAFFSSAELVFAKANEFRIKREADSGNKIAKKEKFIKDNYTRTLSTVLVGNDLVNVATSTVSTLLFVGLLESRYGQGVGQSVASVAATFLLLIFGETLPKIIGATIPDKLSKLYAIPLRFYMTVLYPVVKVVDTIVGSLSKLWTPKEKDNGVTTEELMEIVDDIEDDGVFSEKESEMIKSAIDFTETTAQDILIPRVDVFAIDIDDVPETFGEEFYKFSRVPVYRDSIDNIIGILPVKRLLREKAAGHEFKLEDLLVEPLFVHKTKTISSIIDEFRVKHLQMAIVVDEFGGTMGILTMEDITEEIFGDIFDERDDVESEIRPIGENVYEVDGGTNIEDLFDELDWEPTDFETEYTTVGGWVTEMLDKFPDEGDFFDYQRIHVEVTSATSMRVEKVVVTYTPPPDEEEEEDEDEEKEKQ